MKTDHSCGELSALTPKSRGESLIDDFDSESHIHTSAFDGNPKGPFSNSISDQERQNREIYETADHLYTLMACVIGNISLAKMELKPGSTADKYLDEAAKACTQTKLLTDELIRASKNSH